MFERYSSKARRVIFFARYEASQFGSSAIDTEHFLLGILRESQDFLHAVAPSVEIETIRKRIREQVPIREKIPTSLDLPLSESAKRALTSATEEADRAGSRNVCARHILLGLLGENCLAQRILGSLGVSLEAARAIAAGWAETGGGSPALHLPEGVTGRAAPNLEFQRVIADAIDEASLLHSTSAGPEHLLLGLLRNEKSLAARILQNAGLNLADLRRKLEGN